MRTAIIYYHKACSDGLAAAVVYYSYYVSNGGYDQYIFKAINHDEIQTHIDFLRSTIPMDRIKQYTVRFLDLSIHLAEYQSLLPLIMNGFDIKVIDHHKTTQDELGDILLRIAGDISGLTDKYNTVYYDVQHSGAGLAWRAVYGTKVAAPPLIQYVEDRDLWRFVLPFSNEINAGLNALLNMDYDMVHDQRNRLKLEPHPGETGFLNNRVPYLDLWHVEIYNSSFLPFDTWSEQYKLVGRVINKMNDRHLSTLSSLSGSYLINGHRVRICNSPLHISDLGDYLNKKYGPTHKTPCSYVLVWRYDSTNHVCYVSLRSDPEKGADCSKIASQFSGGGGHEHAAGFRCSLETIMSLMTNPVNDTF